MKKDILGFIHSIIFGAVISKIGDMFEWLYENIVNHFSVVLTIESQNNDMYTWIHAWLSKTVKNNKRILVTTKESSSLASSFFSFLKRLPRFVWSNSI